MRHIESEREQSWTDVGAGLDDTIEVSLSLERWSAEAQELSSQLESSALAQALCCSLALWSPDEKNTVAVGRHHIAMHMTIFVHSY